MMDQFIFSKDILWYLILGVIGLFVIWTVLKGIFGKKEDPKHFQAVRCRNCGWQGRVSSYAGRCPKCRQPLGDQKSIFK